MSSYRWIPWTQPVLSADNGYGLVSASSENTASSAYPWKASDGIKVGETTSWEAAKDAYPAWWLWELPDFGFAPARVSYEDGCKVYFADDSFVVCRFSGTEPLLRIFAEGHSDAQPLGYIEAWKGMLGL